MKKIKQFGEQVEGYAIPVLNEREIRAAAGLLFVMMFVSIMLAGMKGEFTMLKYASTLFLTDILIRVLVSPRFAPSLIMGRFIVRNQVPEYVGAPQKKFAWIIGILLAATMFVHLVLFNASSPITGLLCLICLVFLFFETAFGICLGCKFYPLVFKKKAQYCPGEVCDVHSKQEIQKTSGIQVLIVLGFFAYLTLMIVTMHETFSRKPYDLFGLEKTAQSK
ncbi:MAG: DUF4395 domain-containing protein [Ignavibacteriae bacterium]|nr:MAG: DUF4395 domain-containing protein [Ignavibacteriota bacterium]